VSGHCGPFLVSKDISTVGHTKAGVQQQEVHMGSQQSASTLKRLLCLSLPANRRLYQQQLSVQMGTALTASQLLLSICKKQQL
jgi:hypothetical protein